MQDFTGWAVKAGECQVGFSENLNGLNVHTMLRATMVDHTSTPYVTTVCYFGSLTEVHRAEYATREDALIGHVETVQRIRCGDLFTLR